MSGGEKMSHIRSETGHQFSYMAIKQLTISVYSQRLLICVADKVLFMWEIGCT